MLFSFFLICLTPTIIILGFFFISLTIDQTHKDIEYSQNYAYQAELKIDNFIDQLLKKIDYLSSHSDILADIYLYEISEDYRTPLVKNRIQRAMENILNNQSDIIFATLYTKSQYVFSYGLNPLTEDEINQLISGHYVKDDIQWHHLEVSNEKYLIASKKIKLRYDQEDEVYLLLSLNLAYFNQLCEEIAVSKQHDIIIIDQEGTIIVHPNPLQLFQPIKSIDQYDTLITKELNQTGWEMMNLFSLEMELVSQGEKLIFILTLLILVLSIVWLYFVSKSILMPLQALITKMKRIEHEDLTELPTIEESEMSSDEHAILDASFNQMINRLKVLVTDVYTSKINETELQYRIKELELNALQQQINPHFLYNVLENIFWLADLNGYEVISQMISELGSYFKTSISLDSEYIRLSHEILNVKSYLNLQKIMFENDLEIEWDIEETLLEYKTVKLILQPIIENSLVHGISPQEGTGLIQISGKCVQDKIIFEIRDNGCGMSAEKVLELNQYIRATNGDTKRSVGLRNVNQRIKLYFGDQYGLVIQSELGLGTQVNVVIPIKE